MKSGNKKNIFSAAVLIVLTVVVAVIGVKASHGHRNSQVKQETGFATSQAVEQTAPLGSFEDFQAYGDLVRYDDTTASRWNSADTSDVLLPETNTSGTTAPGTTAKETTLMNSTTDITTTTAKSTTAVTSTTKNTATQQSGTGAAYAYAYAGFNPQLANMNISEWNLLLVNRNYILPDGYVPTLAESVKGSGVNLDYRVAPHYQEMYDAAKKDGITLTPLSGYRRVTTQKTNFENKIQKYVNQGYDRAEATRMAAKIILPPGTSEHNAGLAMDIISLDVDFEETKAFAWLQAHAQDYGFILRYPKDKQSITEITYEPWHWRYVGVSHAKAIKQSGQTLEEYLGVK